MLDPSLSIDQQLQELEPEELKYLRRVCEALRELPLPPAAREIDFEYFDPDELGIDPEEDYDQWQ